MKYDFQSIFKVLFTYIFEILNNGAIKLIIHHMKRILKNIGFGA
jgi:hypothetical protein